MSSLQERLDRIREGFLESAPKEAVAVMHRATEELRAAGLVERIPGPGKSLPAFELLDSERKRVRSSDLLGQGPLVVTFYRGLW